MWKKKDTSSDLLLQTLHKIEKHLATLSEQQETSSREWLTVKDVARELKVSVETVCRWIKSGKLRASSIITPGSRGERNLYRVHRDWLDEVLRENVRPAADGKVKRRMPVERDFIG